jgi:hypothetical protein
LDTSWHLTSIDVAYRVEEQKEMIPKFMEPTRVRRSKVG